MRLQAERANLELQRRELAMAQTAASVELARAFAKKLGAPETQAIECCLQDQLRKAKVAKLRVKLVA